MESTKPCQGPYSCCLENSFGLRIKYEKACILNLKRREHAQQTILDFLSLLQLTRVVVLSLLPANGGG